MQRSIPLNRELERLLEEVGEVAHHLWEKGWAERNAGNISLNVTHCVPKPIEALTQYPLTALDHSYPELSGCSLLVSGTGTRMRELAREPAKNCSILRISEDSHSYHTLWGGPREAGFLPTSEFPSHLSIHQFLCQSGARQKAVIHTHPNELITLTHVAEYTDEAALNSLLWAMHPEVKIVIPEGVGLVPYHPPGSEDLARATVETLDKHRVVLWEKHGCVAIGAGVSEAFDLIDTLNKSAQIFFTCKSAGFTPQGLTTAQLAELEELFPSSERKQ